MLKGWTVRFSYAVNGETRTADFSETQDNDDFSVRLLLDKQEGGSRLTMTIHPKKTLEIRDLFLSSTYSYSQDCKVFVNGYQSWTESREYFPDEYIKPMSLLARQLNNKYYFTQYGDYNFTSYTHKKGEFHGFTYSYIRNEEQFDFIGSLSEANGYTVIEENVKKNQLIIRKDCNGLVIHDDYIPFELFFAEGSEEAVFDDYFKLMKIKPSKLKPVNGYTSWYNYYQNISETIILNDLHAFQEKGIALDIFQIDDGYQTAVGDWLSIDYKKFPHGMKFMADAIKKTGAKAGLWLAPLVCEKTSFIYKNKKDWLLKDVNGIPVTAGCNWSGFYALDFYNPEVRNYIRTVFHTVLDEWGYDLVKLDFLYAVSLIPQHNKTRGTIMTEALDFLRECVKDKLILGCGVPLGPAFGKVDYCRIGCDVGLDWNDKCYMRLIHRERISTVHAITDSIGRHQLNNRAFLNDPDVFLLRKNNIKLTDREKKTLVTANKIFGSVLFTSDDIGQFDIEQMKILTHAFEMKNRMINHVVTFRNKVTKVSYSEDHNHLLALFNLGNKKQKVNVKESLSEEVQSDGSAMPFNERYIVLEPHESRIFKIKL